MHTELPQPLIEREQILSVGAKRPWRDTISGAMTCALVSASNSGWRGSIIKTNALTVRPSSRSSFAPGRQVAAGDHLRFHNRVSSLLPGFHQASDRRRR